MAMRFLFVFLLVLLPQHGMSADCSEVNITLSTQSDVDSFQGSFGPCDTVTGNIIISGTMNNLDGLLALNHVSGDVTIEELIEYEHRLRTHPVSQELNRAWMVIAQKPL